MKERLKKLSNLISKVHSAKPEKATKLLDEFEKELDKVSLNPEKKYKLKKSDYPPEYRKIWLAKEGIDESDVEWID